MKLYVVSLLLQKNDGRSFTFSHSLHIKDAKSQEEAIGIAIGEAEKMKPGFSISDPLCHEIMDIPTQAKESA